MMSQQPPNDLAELRVEVLSVLRERFGIDSDKVTDSSAFKDDLDLDSIDFFDMTGLLEKRYGFDLNFSEFVGVVTFGDFITTLERVLTQRNS